MFSLFSFSSGLEFWSVNHAPINKIYKLKVYKIMKVLGKISNNLPNDLVGASVCKTIESCW